MKALFTPRTAGEKMVVITSLLALIFWSYPETLVHAQGVQDAAVESALVFEVKNPAQNQITTEKPITPENILAQNLKKYLEDHNSPLAEYSEQIITYNKWKMALSISWVESNFGKYCPGKSNNCSGIGVAPGHPLWRTYPDKLAWFEDLNKLLNKPFYAEKYNTFRKMKGIYVYPGSENWVRGAEKKFAELSRLEEVSKQTENTLTESKETPKLISSNIALLTFPSIASNLD